MGKKPLLIVGAGNINEPDWFGAENFDVMCAGRGIEGCNFNIDYFACWCVDGNWFNGVMTERIKNGANTDFQCFSFIITGGFQHLPLPLNSAGSGFYAVQVGLHLGYDKIVLADCPLDNYCESHKEGWEIARESLKDKVRSLSGYTKDLFGEPTEDWLKQ